LGEAPAADFSLLLLVLCLTTHAPALGYQPTSGVTGSTEQQSLYLTARSLLSQTQVSCTPSISLVQAGLLLAVYEYIHGRPDDAFVTIAGSARIAYAARIHTRESLHTQTLDGSGSNMDSIQAEEAANTWWGLVICERYVLNDVSSTERVIDRAKLNIAQLAEPSSLRPWCSTSL